MASRVQAARLSSVLQENTEIRVVQTSMMDACPALEIQLSQHSYLLVLHRPTVRGTAQMVMF